MILLHTHPQTVAAYVLAVLSSVVGCIADEYLVEALISMICGERRGGEAEVELLG